MKNSDTLISNQNKYGKELPGVEKHRAEQLSLVSAAREKYNAFISLDVQELEKQAADVPESAGEDRNPLSGVTAVLSDNICSEDMKTTCGSRMLENYLSPDNAYVVDKLKDAGVSIVGKGNMDEFGVGDSRGVSFFGPSKNPWDIERTAGSGIAGAVALGEAVFGLGSDARGGLRQAAAFSGLAGLKPGYGRISRWGLIDYAPSLDQIGIIARSAADIALVLECIAGEDSRDPSTLNNPAPRYTETLKEDVTGLKLGLLKGWGQVESLEPEVEVLLEKELARLKDLGCILVEVDLPHFFQASSTATIIGAVEAFSTLSNFDGVRFGFRIPSKHLQEMYINSRTEGFGSFLKQYVTFGALASSEKYFNEIFVSAQKLRTKIKEELEESLKTVDMIAAPAVPFRAPLLSDLDSRYGLDSSANIFTAAANLAGNPALTIPVTSDDDLPAGLQLIGRFFDEGKLLSVLHALENK